MTQPTARPMSGETDETLRAEVSRLTAAFDQMSRSYSARTIEAQEINELRADAETKLAKAREVIRPFAAISLVQDQEPSGPDMIDAPDLAITPTQVRAARAFLEEK